METFHYKLWKMEKKITESLVKLFHYYEKLGRAAIQKLDDDGLFKAEVHSNSISIIVNHLRGNMKSRWTNFLNEDGEKPWRDRDREFEDIFKTKDDILDAWKEGWTILFETLDSISDSDLQKICYIRNEGHTVLEAIHRQLAHYSYHIGQMIFISKELAGSDWVSLSIAKGASSAYNKNKFKSDKIKIHFTDKV